MSSLILKLNKMRHEISFKLYCYEAKPGLYEEFIIKKLCDRSGTFCTKSKANLSM